MQTFTNTTIKHQALIYALFLTLNFNEANGAIQIAVCNLVQCTRTHYQCIMMDLFMVTTLKIVLKHFKAIQTSCRTALMSRLRARFNYGAAHARSRYATCTADGTGKLYNCTTLRRWPQSRHTAYAKGSLARVIR
jgi:hypothetical protein